MKPSTPYRWLWRRYEALTLDELYAWLALRQRVFIVEQTCPYLDADGLDQAAWHLLGVRVVDGALVAGLRVVPPGGVGPDVHIGRVVTDPQSRGEGLGRALMEEGLAWVADRFRALPIQIFAQAYLERFYAALGFETRGAPYDEDGIEHVVMIRPPDRLP